MIITGIDFDDYSVKIIQVKKDSKGRVRLLKLCSTQIPQDEDETKDIKIAQTIDALIKKNKIKIVNLHTCINRQFVTIRWLELPSVDEKELVEMVKFQAGKLLPYPLEELIIDFQILSQQDNSTQVMLVVAHNDIVNKHLQILKQIKLEPTRILLTSEAIFNSYRHTQLEIPLSIAILDIGFATTDIIFINQNRLLFTRSVSIPRGDPLKGIAEELRTSLNAYKREIKGAGIEKIILSGELASLKGLDKRLEEDIGIPVEICTPFKGFIVPPEKRGQKSEDRAQRSDKMPQLTTVVGLVIGSAEKRIDLLPESIKINQRQKDKHTNFILSGILVILLILSLSVLTITKLCATYQYIDYLDKEIRINLPLAKDMELKKKRLDAISEQMSKQQLSLDILAEIYRLIPLDISLNELIFEKETLTIIRGEARNMSTVFSLISTLEDSDYFKNVKVNYATKRRVGNREVTDFQINCPLEKEGL
ncbi:MAG: pilus assembly protein PilM [bacterium]